MSGRGEAVETRLPSVAARVASRVCVTVLMHADGCRRTVVAVLAASVLPRVAVTTDDGNWLGHRDGMMSSRSYDQRWAAWLAARMDDAGPDVLDADGQRVRLPDRDGRPLPGGGRRRQAAGADRRIEMREFGAAIVASQSAQIDQMQQWLSDWYPTRSGQADYQPMMRDLTGPSGTGSTRCSCRTWSGTTWAR